MRRVAIGLVFLAGCADGGEPCKGIQTCISARVDGAVSGLDQLRIILDGLGVQMTPTPAAPFDLPVRLAIGVPAGMTSASVSVEGLHAGQVIASSGALQTVTLHAGIPASKNTFTLFATMRDGFLQDDGGSDGAPPGVVSFNPKTIDFGSVKRGITAAEKTTMLVNNTNRSVTGTLMTPLGPADPFRITAAGACLSGANTAVALSPGESCAITFDFTAPVHGSFLKNLSITLDSTDVVGLSLVGQATSAWTAEMAPDPADLEGAWGSSHGDIYAVGHNASGGIYHSTSQGGWSHFGTNSNNCFSVSGVDAQHVFVGCDSGNILSVSGVGLWKDNQPTSTTAIVRSVWAQDVNYCFGGFDSGTNQIFKALIGATSSTFFGQLSPLPPVGFRGVCGAGQRVVAVGANGQWFVSDATGANFQQQTTLSFTLNGCWMPDASNVWIVGTAPVGPNGEQLPGLLNHCTLGATVSCASEVPGTSTGNLNAISGRRDSTSGKLELWVVGAMGGQALTSDGGGTWNKVATPQPLAMSGVWVNPEGGEVVTVGKTGQINHLY